MTTPNLPRCPHGFLLAGRCPTGCTDDRPLNLDTVVSILQRDYLIPAYVDMTGGGVATIFTGPYNETTERHTGACAGPGTYGHGDTPSTADRGDFYVGRDDNGATDPTEPQVWSEEHVAALISLEHTAAVADDDEPPTDPQVAIHFGVLADDTPYGPAADVLDWDALNERAAEIGATVMVEQSFTQWGEDVEPGDARHVVIQPAPSQARPMTRQGMSELVNQFAGMLNCQIKAGTRLVDYAVLTDPYDHSENSEIVGFYA